MLRKEQKAVFDRYAEIRSYNEKAEAANKKLPTYQEVHIRAIYQLTAS